MKESMDLDEIRGKWQDKIIEQNKIYAQHSKFIARHPEFSGSMDAEIKESLSKSMAYSECYEDLFGETFDEDMEKHPALKPKGKT